VLNRLLCRCARKNAIANEIAGLGDPNFYLFIVILCELTIKYVIGLGRFVRILEDQLKWYKGTILFNVQQNMFVCMC
jgi:hypothetical protein